MGQRERAQLTPLEVADVLLVEIVSQRQPVVTWQRDHGPVPFYELWNGVGPGVEVTGTGTQQRGL